MQNKYSGQHYDTERKTGELPSVIRAGGTSIGGTKSRFLGFYRRRTRTRRSRHQYGSWSAVYRSCVPFHIGDHYAAGICTS